MIDVWGIKFDEHFGVWKTRAIDVFGTETRYIHGANVMIAPEGSINAREWAKNPNRVIAKIYPDLGFDEIISSVLDIVKNSAIITFRMGDEYYTATCGKEVGCFISKGGLETVPLPQSPAGWKYLPELFYTAVKPGNGYVLGMRKYLWGKLYIAWRPGTFITQAEKPPKFEFLYTNEKPWVVDEEGYHVKGSLERRPDNFDYDYVIDTPTFTVLRGKEHDLIVTDFVEQKIQTNAKDPRDFFWKIFTGNYTVL